MAISGKTGHSCGNLRRPKEDDNKEGGGGRSKAVGDIDISGAAT